MTDKEMCIIVVWYNPNEKVLENISEWMKLNVPIIVIDNTEGFNQYAAAINNQKNIYYFPLKKNKGLSEALYIGCEKAIEKDFKYVLTMDQDTIIPNESILKLLSRMKARTENENVAIVCPEVYAFKNDDEIVDNTYPVYCCEKDEEKYCNWVMTSASLMDLNLYQRAGKFDRALFIDHIDIDIGIKFKKIGAKILRVPGTQVYQHLGHSREKRFLWRKIHPMFDSPIRTYYIVRNQLYLMRVHGWNYWKFTNVSFAKILIKIVFYEPKKWIRLKMMFQGIHDAFAGKMGENRN